MKHQVTQKFDFIYFNHKQYHLIDRFFDKLLKSAEI